jgi:hypothetical protein
MSQRIQTGIAFMVTKKPPRSIKTPVDGPAIAWALDSLSTPEAMKRNHTDMLKLKMKKRGR